MSSRFNKFFSNYLPALFALSMISNENDFAFIRHQLLNKPTIPEYQIASRIAKPIDANSKEELNDPLVNAHPNRQTKPGRNPIIRYTYEKRLQSNKKRYASIMESNISTNTGH